MIQTLSEIKNSIANILSVKPESLHFNLTLKNDLGLDSIDIVELVVDMERQFGVIIPDNRTLELITVADLTKEVAHAANQN